jgi:hypothetical protein
MRILFVMFVFIISFSCKEKKQGLKEKQKEIEIGKLDSANTYTVEEIGWTVLLPEGWEVITKEELKRISEKGKKEMEKTFETKIDDSGVQELISIRKDKFNSLISNMQKFDSVTDGTYDERVMALNEMLRVTYRSKNMKIEDKVGATRIGGVMFDIIDIKIFAPDDDKKVILYQSFYSAFINGYDFTINMNYNNETFRKVLAETVNSSKFSLK